MTEKRMVISATMLTLMIFSSFTLITFASLPPIDETDLSEVCHLNPIEDGKTPCNIAPLLKYTYNASTRQCEPYYYGGCFGTKNMFSTYEECILSCHPTVNSRVVRSSQQIKPSKCNLLKKDGICGAHIIRFYYHKKSNKCRKFIYGGCGGNDNNFRSIAECRTACNADPFD